MNYVPICIVLCLLRNSNVQANTWKPRTGLPMIHGKDFSARSLPIIYSPGGAAGSSSSVTGVPGEPTAGYRGGHASTKLRKQPDDDEQREVALEQTIVAILEEQLPGVASPRGGNESSSECSSIVTEIPVKIVPELTKKELKFKAKSAAKYAKKLKSRNHTNIRRKVMHACFGLGFATMNHLIPRAQFVPSMTILTGATLLMELLRYRKYFGWMNDALHLVLGSSLRKHEMEGKFTGSFYFFLGVTVTAALFPTSCATLGICQLALADPSASYFGKMTRDIYWSRIEKSVI